MLETQNMRQVFHEFVHNQGNLWRAAVQARVGFIRTKI